MAIDVHLKIDGIRGESADAEHMGWIECQSATWSISQPKSATSSTGGGHTAERAELSDIHFVKLADLASPLLMQNCATGRTFPRAKFEFLRADGNGERIKYFEIELEYVLIGTVTPTIEPGSIMTEHVGLKYAKVNWKYTQQRVAGGSCGNTAGGWDACNNRVY